MDKIVKAYAFDKMVRIYSITSTDIVEHARKLFDCYPTSIAALGRTLTIAAMMGSMYKQDETIAVKIDGQGPTGPIIVEADGLGNVRGRIGNPQVFLHYENGPFKGHLNVGDAVGRNGFVTVVKDLNMKAPFTSSSPIQSGEIADDFTYFFALSEQVPTSVAAGVLVNPDNSVKAAGGFIVQIMPNCPDEVISYLEDKLNKIKPVSQMIDEGYDAIQIINEITDKFDILEELPAQYKCNCSKYRFRAGLKKLNIDTLKDLLKDEEIETTCHFCNASYVFKRDAIELIIKEKETEN